MWESFFKLLRAARWRGLLLPPIRGASRWGCNALSRTHHTAHFRLVLAAFAPCAADTMARYLIDQHANTSEACPARFDFVHAPCAAQTHAASQACGIRLKNLPLHVAGVLFVLPFAHAGFSGLLSQRLLLMPCSCAAAATLLLPSCVDHSRCSNRSPHENFWCPTHSALNPFVTNCKHQPSYNKPPAAAAYRGVTTRASPHAREPPPHAAAPRETAGKLPRNCRRAVYASTCSLRRRMVLRTVTEDAVLRRGAGGSRREG